MPTITTNTETTPAASRGAAPAPWRRLALQAAALALCALPRQATDAADLAVLTPQELDAVVQEIRRMIATDADRVPAFAVREATPQRIERLFRSPQLQTLPRNVRENGLIFAGLGSALLTFEKPSDVIAKVAQWFPEELAQSRQGSRPGLFGNLRLWGPYEHWLVEPMAFMSLWKCTPQQAWLAPDQNPFALSANPGGHPLLPVAARQSSEAEFDFAHCLRNNSGSRPSWTREQMPVNAARVAAMADAVQPLLQRKFASALQQQRCRDTGPDDCVLVLRQWASLAPADAGLAAAMQALEAEIAPDAELPELRNPNAGWAQSQLQDGQQRFDLALRRAAYLRAKLQSVLAAPQAWPPTALAAALRQLSRLRQVFAAPYVQRWYFYTLDGRNDPINPWRVFDALPDAGAGLRQAVLAELDSLAPDTDCAVFQQWFDHAAGSLRSDYLLGRLRRGSGLAHRCATPDFPWLRQQEATQFRSTLYGYLAVLQSLPPPERQALLLGLTDGRALCTPARRPVGAGWLQQLCAEPVRPRSR